MTELKASLILPYYNRKPHLKATLNSLRFWYGSSELEVVIVDDCSSDEHRVEDLVDNCRADLAIKLIRIESKTGINPCYPYNVGARNATGNIFILSSPETSHVSSIFELTNNFNDLTPNQYYCFSVFCPTIPAINEFGLECKSMEDFTNLRKKVEEVAYDGVGAGGDSFASVGGSWYLHSKYRPTAYNFLTAMRCELYYELGGFDERFRRGTGFDDEDFRDRLIAKIGWKNVQWFDDCLAVHLNHQPVYGSGDPISNQALFNKIRSAQEPAYQLNDAWGKL